MVIEWEPTVFIKKMAKWPNVAKWIDIIILTHSKERVLKLKSTGNVSQGLGHFLNIFILTSNFQNWNYLVSL